MNNATNAMLLTAPGMAAIAVIRLSGPGAPEIVAQLHSRASGMKPGDFQHAILRRNGAVLDDALLLRLDDSRFEFHLHGGKAVIDGVLEALAILGATVLPPDFQSPDAAWPNDDTISREVMAAMHLAVTPTAVRLLAAQRAALPAFARALLQEHDAGKPLWQAQSALQWLLHRSNHLAFLLATPRVAIVGPPNAGKSTLANALLGRPSSITSDMPGTTRDWVDATALFVAGDVQVAVTLIDTAGVRETGDPIEAESIRRSISQAAQADLVLALLDSANDAGDLTWLKNMDRTARRMLIVWNKCDMAAARARPLPVARRELHASATQHLHLNDLTSAALAELGVAEVGTECFAFSQRQRGLLEAAARCAPSMLKEHLQSFLNDRRSAP